MMHLDRPIYLVREGKLIVINSHGQLSESNRGGLNSVELAEMGKRLAEEHGGDFYA